MSCDLELAEVSLVSERRGVKCGWVPGWDPWSREVADAELSTAQLADGLTFCASDNEDLTIEIAYVDGTTQSKTFTATYEIVDLAAMVEKIRYTFPQGLDAGDPDQIFFCEGVILDTPYTLSASSSKLAR